MESLVQALGRSRAKCREFSTLRKKNCKKILVDGLGNVATSGLNVTTLKYNSTRVRRDVELNVVAWKSNPLWNVTTLDANVATFIISLSGTSQR